MINSIIYIYKNNNAAIKQNSCIFVWSDGKCCGWWHKLAKYDIKGTETYGLLLVTTKLDISL